MQTPRLVTWADAKAKRSACIVMDDCLSSSIFAAVEHSESPPCHCLRCLQATAKADQARGVILDYLHRIAVLDFLQRLIHEELGNG